MNVTVKRDEKQEQGRYVTGLQAADHVLYELVEVYKSLPHHLDPGDLVLLGWSERRCSDSYRPAVFFWQSGSDFYMLSTTLSACNLEKLKLWKAPPTVSVTLSGERAPQAATPKASPDGLSLTDVRGLIEILTKVEIALPDCSEASALLRRLREVEVNGIKGSRARAVAGAGPEASSDAGA